MVNNVETLTNVPLIMDNGADWYRTLWHRKEPRASRSSAFGLRQQPGNYELPLGTTFRELIYDHGGGIPDGRKIKAIMPAGASSSLIVATDASPGYARWITRACPNVGAQLGSASVIVVDESVNIAWLVNKTVHFFKHESCGKCTPCREGTYWMLHLTERIDHGKATREDVELLQRCRQPDAEASACAPWVNFPSKRCSRASSASRQNFRIGG